MIKECWNLRLNNEYQVEIEETELHDFREFLKENSEWEEVNELDDNFRDVQIGYPHYFLKHLNMLYLSDIIKEFIVRKYSDYGRIENQMSERRVLVKLNSGGLREIFLVPSFIVYNDNKYYAYERVDKILSNYKYREEIKSDLLTFAEMDCFSALERKAVKKTLKDIELL